MWICPECLVRQSDDLGECPRDRSPLLALGEGDPRLGTLAGGRHLLLDVLGSGGMSRIYRAYQRSMHRMIALKTLSGPELADVALKERFMREARATAQLRSPHTIVLHDFGVFDSGELFIAMELVAGRSLDRVIDEEAPLSSSRAFALLGQIAESLDEAHEAGLVHRDVKPSNIMVEVRGGVEHVKVLDFGLVKITADNTPTITRDGWIHGTPQYMAPEMWSERYGVVGPATDVYALAIIAYQLLSKKKPFVASSVPALMHAHVYEEPRLLGLPIDPVFVRALAKKPEDRFQSASDLVRTLVACGDTIRTERPSDPAEAIPPAGRAPSVSAPRILAPDLGPSATPVTPSLSPIAVHDLATRPPTASARLKMPPNLTAMIGALLALVIAAAGAFIVFQDRSNSAPQSGVRVRRALAVLDLKNLTAKPENSWLSTALAEMLSTELAAGDQIRTIATENVARMKLELALPDVDTLAADTLAKIRKNLGCDLLVTGSYLAIGSKIRVDLHLQDTETGELLASVGETGTEDDLFDLIDQLGAKLRERLRVGAVTEPDALTVRASLPANPKAARFYSEGLAKLRRFEPRAARELLEKAIEAEPEFALSHFAFAEALAMLGAEREAAAAVKRAFELCGALRRSDRLRIEARYLESISQRDKAIAIYRSLLDFFPDDVDLGLALARAQNDAAKAADSLATITELRKLPAPWGDDPRLDVAEADAVGSTSEFEKMLALAVRAAKHGEERGSRWIAARARLFEGWAYYNLGDFERAMQAERASLEHHRAVGDRRGEAENETIIAALEAQSGRDDRAVESSDRAISLLRELGADGLLPVILGNSALLLIRAGSFELATERIAEVREIAQRRDQRESIATANTEEAILRHVTGDAIGAKASIDAGFAGYQAIENPRMVAWTLALRGELELTRGDLAAAKRDLEESLLMRDRLGLARFAAESRELLARLALEERRSSDAETLARAAVEALGKGKILNQIRARATLAHALLQAGKLEEARAEVQRALELASRIDDFEARAHAKTIEARVRAASGEREVAARELAAELAETEKKGFIAAALQQRLVLAELQGDRRSAAALQRDARARGFELIAAQAGKLAK